MYIVYVCFKIILHVFTFVSGNSVFNNENAYIIVEKVAVDDIGQIMFVFYPAKAVATIKFIQR